MPRDDRRGRTARPASRDEPWLAAAGGAVVGLLVGAVAGAVLGAVAIARTNDVAWFGKAFAAGALLGAVGGAFRIGAAFAALEAMMHFLFGFALGPQEDAESPVAPAWLRAVFWAGAALGVVTWLWARFGAR